MKRILIPLAGLCLLTACNPSSHQQTEKSVTQTVNTDSIQVLHGQLIMGHEAYSFTPDADTTAYWVVDKSGELKKRYEAALPSDAKPYTAIPAKLKVRIQGPSSEGFAAEYAGVMEVMEIEEVGE